MSKVLTIMAVCAGLAVLTIGSCAGLLYMGFRNTNTAVTPRIETLLSAIQNDRFGETYDTETTAELRSTLTREQYETLGRSIAVRLGPMKSIALEGFKMRQFNADTFLDVAYNAAFEKGNGTIAAKLKKQNGEWKFEAFRVNSPVFSQDVVTEKCSACGAPHAAIARFCPACGAEVTAAKTEPTKAATE